MKKSIFKRIDFFSIVFSIIVFQFSLYLFPYYTDGDQIGYTLFYEDLPSFSFIDGYVAYRSYIGSGEPFYYLLIYIFSGWAPKIPLISVINAIMAYFLSVNLVKLRVNKLIILSLIFNFYFLVLLFSAERLKVSLTLLIIALSTPALIKSYFFLLLAILSHLQSLILIFVIKFDALLQEIRKRIPKNMVKRFFVYLVIIGTVLAIIFVMRDYIQDKYMAYADKAGIANLFKPLALYLLTIPYAKGHYLKVSLIFIPLMLASVLVGEERIVIFCYFIFFSYACKVNRGINIGMLITLVYFLIKGIEFYQNVLEHNTGFI